MNHFVFNTLRLFAAAFGMLVLVTVNCLPLELKHHKDRLFGYPGILMPDSDNRYIVVDYRETRDINGRDQIPERRVWGRYVSLKVRRQQQELAIETPFGRLAYFAVGATSGSRIITVYVHGKGGNRKQGINDYTFGGNFNRLKNLMVRNGGLYISTDVPGFNTSGAAAIGALITHYREDSPGAPVFVACGSLGGQICYSLASDPELAKVVAGYVLLGAPPVDSIYSSPAVTRKAPFLLAHGSRDTVYSIDEVEAHFRRFDARNPGYPVRFVRFETGTHGTPIRMIDWRDTLNWMLSVSEKQK